MVFYVFPSYCFIAVLIITVSYVIIILNVKSSPQSHIFGSKLLVEKKLSITLFVMTVASFLTILPGFGCLGSYVDTHMGRVEPCDNLSLSPYIFCHILM